MRQVVSVAAATGNGAAEAYTASHHVDEAALLHASEVPDIPSGVLIEQSFGLDQIGRVEPFGEPAEDRRQKITRLARLALPQPKLRQADRSLKFE